MNGNSVLRAMAMVGVMVGGLLASTPAEAGHYELLENELSGLGSAEATCNDPYSMYYPGSVASLPNLPFNIATASGTITYNASETWEFQWVPDSGKTIEEDPPVDDAWEVTYMLNINGYTSGYSPNGGSMQGTLSVYSDQGDFTYTKTGTLSVGDDPYGEGGAGTYSENTSGKWFATVVMVLSGANPTVTITADGSGSVSGALWMELGVSREQPPTRPIENIRHLYPKKMEPYITGRSIQPRGEWRGRTGVYYNIFQVFDGDGTSNLMGYLWPTALAPAGIDYVDQNWTGKDVTPQTHSKVYRSLVILQKWVAAQNKFEDTGKASWIDFVGSSAE